MAPTGPPTMKVPLSEGKRQRPCRREGRTSTKENCKCAGKTWRRKELINPSLLAAFVKLLRLAPRSPQLAVAFAARSFASMADGCEFAVVMGVEPLFARAPCGKALLGSLLLSGMLANRLGRAPATNLQPWPC